MTSENRLKIVMISWELLKEWFVEGQHSFCYCTKGLPKDAKLIGISDQPYFGLNQIALKFWSAEFDPISEGTQIPLLTISVSTIDKSNLISIGKAARLLGVHPDTLRKWEKTGKLTSRKTVGSHRRFLLSEIEELRHKRKLMCEVIKV